jgi:hypothetical protein
MPTVPQGQKRPVEVISDAVKVKRIATGEAEEVVVDVGNDPATKALG